jgi:hypothetical protein
MAARQLYLGQQIGVEPPPPWVQMSRLWARNFGALAGRGLRRAASACARTSVRALAAVVAAAGGSIARLPGCSGLAAGTARAVLAILGKSSRVEGPRPAAGSVIIANRCGQLDPVSLLAVLGGRAVLCGQESLAGLGGWAAYVARPAMLERTRAAEALASGRSVIVTPDGPIGAAAGRSRYRLEGLDAALAQRAALIPVAVLEVRGRTILRFGRALDAVAGDARAARLHARDAVARLFSE